VIRLTKFQQKVYKVVSTIPKGQTRSYKWVAQKIGNPDATRAVGQALKRNPFIGEVPNKVRGKVPCHRVIRSDGSLGGFAKGVKRKKEMLEAESC